MLHKDSTVA